LELNHFTFVPGVELSGTFPVSKGQLQTTTLQISGTTAAGGTVRVGAGKLVTGTLGGKRFSINVAKVKLSRAGRTDSGKTDSGASAWSTGRSLIGPAVFPLPGPIIRDQPARLR
jgi:hypothetical protein